MELVGKRIRILPPFTHEPALVGAVAIVRGYCPGNGFDYVAEFETMSDYITTKTDGLVALARSEFEIMGA